MSLRIWQQLANNEQKELHMPSLSKTQKNELNFIRQEFEKHLNKLGLATLHHSVIKTEKGYTFFRKCKRKDCGKCLHVKINFTNRTGTICSEGICNKQ